MKNTPFSKYFKCTNRGFVKLNGGEHTTMRFGSFRNNFYLRDVVQRLMVLGYSTAPGLSGVPGINDTLITGYALKGIDRLYYFTTKGTVSGASDSELIGLNSTKIHCVVKNNISWTCQGLEFLQTPTRTTNFAGAANRQAADDDVVVIQ